MSTQDLIFKALSIPTTHNCPNDAVALYTSPNSITAPAIGPLGWLIDDTIAYVAYVIVQKANLQLYVIINGDQGVNIKATAGVINIIGPAVFAATDIQYYVGIRYQDKGYDTSTDTYKTFVNSSLFGTLGLQSTHFIPNDGTAANTSPTQITVAGLPFTVDDANCLITCVVVNQLGSIYVIKNGTEITPGNVTYITSTANVISIVNSPVALAGTDVYFIYIQQQNKAYTSLPPLGDYFNFRKLYQPDGSIQPATHIIPFDGTATYTSPTQITITNMPFVPDDTNCYVSWLMVFDTAAGEQHFYRQGEITNNGPLGSLTSAISFSITAGLLSVGNISVALQATDIYTIGIVAQNKAYDATLNELKQIPWEHSQVHSGLMNFISNYTTNVQIATPFYWLIRTGLTLSPHIKFTFNASGSGLVEIFRTPTTTADGTAITINNNNDNLVSPATTVAFFSPTVTADGTLWFNDFIPGGNNLLSRFGGVARNDTEIILALNTDYLIKFTPTVNGTNISLNAEFYEL